MDYDNDNSGVLFKNDRKEKVAQPDYKGHAEIDGQEFWLSAWIKEGKKGKFMSLAFTPRDRGGQPESQPTGQPGNDDIPF
jgi:hypothetical protein